MRVSNCTHKYFPLGTAMRRHSPLKSGYLDSSCARVGTIVIGSTVSVIAATKLRQDMDVLRGITTKGLLTERQQHDSSHNHCRRSSNRMPRQVGMAQGYHLGAQSVTNWLESEANSNRYDQ